MPGEFSIIRDRMQRVKVDDRQQRSLCPCRPACLRVPGRLWRSSGLSGPGRRSLVPSGHRQLGGGLRQTQPAWGLHQGQQVHLLDPQTYHLTRCSYSPAARGCLNVSSHTTNNKTLSDCLLIKDPFFLFTVIQNILTLEKEIGKLCKYIFFLIILTLLNYIYKLSKVWTLPIN